MLRQLQSLTPVIRPDGLSGNREIEYYPEETGLLKISPCPQYLSDAQSALVDIIKVYMLAQKHRMLDVSITFRSLALQQLSRLHLP
jgi:hypothetical protein